MSRKDDLERYETTDAQGLIRLLETLRPSREVHAPPDFQDKVLARVKRQRASQRFSTWWRLGWPPRGLLAADETAENIDVAWWRRSPAGAFVVVVLLLSLCCNGLWGYATFAGASPSTFVLVLLFFILPSLGLGLWANRRGAQGLAVALLLSLSLNVWLGAHSREAGRDVVVLRHIALLHLKQYVEHVGIPPAVLEKHEETPSVALKRQEEIVAALEQREYKKREYKSGDVFVPQTARMPAASVGIPNTKMGDTYVIEYLDPDNPKSRYSTEQKVVSVSEEKITVASKNINSQTVKPRMLQFTSEWNLLSSRNPDGGGLDYSPSLKYFDFPLYPGKTWQQTSRETDLKTSAVREHTLSATVGEWEEITVPAGTFRALKITIQIVILDRATEQKSTGTDTSWYAPIIRRRVKSDTTSQDLQGQQKRLVIQLIRYDLKEGQAPMQDGVANIAGKEERQGIEANIDSTRISPLIPVLGNAHKAVSLLTQMVTRAMQNGGEGQEAQLEALQQQIKALPKPKRGDRKAARLHNDQGLEAFKKDQYEQALQSFLTAYQLDASDAEVVNNIGLMYLKTGHLEEAARYLGGALSLTPNRAMAWANLAEVFAHGIHPEEAVAAYALTYRFSKNKDTTRRYLETQTTNAYDPLVMQAAKSALALSPLK